MTDYSEKDFELGHENAKWLNDRIIKLYASISNQGEEYWQQVIYGGGYELVDFDADKLAELGMVNG